MSNFHAIVSFLVFVGLVSRIVKWYKRRNETSFFDYVIWPKNVYNISPVIHTILNIISLLAYVCVLTDVVELF